MGGDGEAMSSTPGPALPDRRVLRDDRLDATLREQGVVVVNLMTPDQVAEVSEVILDIYRGDAVGQHYTLLSEDFDYRYSVFDTVPGLLAEASDRVFSNYKFCASSLGFKWPGDDAVLGPHQDITLVDERHSRSYNLWLPLVDTDERNGALRFLKGSHRVLDNIRTMPSGPTNFLHETETLPLDALELVPTRLGQAIVFDHAMLHGSGPNLTDRVRPAVIAAYRPAEADLLHHFLPDLEGRDVQRYFAGGDFYRNQLVGQQPEGEPIEVIPFYGTPRSREEILTRSRALCPPADLAALSSGRGTVDSDPVGPEVRRTLLDDDLQDHLEEHGYAVFDVLDPDDVARLKAVVDDVFPGEREGFHASNVRNDHDYRRLVHQRVGPTLERALSPLLDDYALCNTLSTMKFPGDDSGFVVHQDWKMVDERRFRGINVWCPLVDTDEGNGGLLVLPGSHRQLNAVRCGPDFPTSYQAPGLSVTWDQMLPVPVRAGQALLFDHRLLHGSGPNRSDELRPAVVAVMAPAEAQLMHWFLPDPEKDRLEVQAIDLDFFCDFEVGVRPDYPTIAEIEFVPDRISAAELLAACGGGRSDGAPADDVGPDASAEPALDGTDGPAPTASTLTRTTASRPSRPRRLARRVRRRLGRR